MKRLLWIPLLFCLIGRVWAQTGPPTCSVTGLVKNADGSPLVNGTIQFNSKNIQVVNGIVINPTLVTTNTDSGGNIRAISVPQLLVMQVTICPPATGQGQPSGCSAPFSVIIPNTSTANFGNLSMGTLLVQPLPPPGTVGQVLGSNSGVSQEWETLGGGTGSCTFQWVSAGNYQLNCPGYQPLLSPSSPISVTSGGTGTGTAPTAPQILIAQSATAYAPELLSGDASLTAAGIITVSKLNGITPGGACSGGKFVSLISASGVPTCTTPSGGGVPAGGPPQLVGYSATNTGEAETLSGDFTLTRAGANSYTATVTKLGGVTVGALATLGVGTGLTSSGGNLNLSAPVSVVNGGLGNTTPAIAGQIDIAQSATVIQPKTVSGDAVITSAGVITVSKTSGTAFGPLATAATVSDAQLANAYSGIGTCTGGQFVTTLARNGAPTCAAPSGGAVPNGAPPQLVGYSATNTGEAETLSGDNSVTRGGTNSYLMITTGLHFGSANAVALPTTAPTSGGIPYFSSATAIASSAVLAASAPVIGGGAGVAPSTGTRSGSTTIFGTTSGILTNGDCVKIDASGNLVDAGGACGLSGGPTFPNGAPPQLAGFSATNVSEAETLSGDATLTRAGLNSYTISVTKTAGTAFTALATATVPLSIANGGRGSTTAPTIGQIDVASATTAFTPVTMSADCTITSAGAITCTKTSGTAFTALATAAVPLSVANGGLATSTAPTIGQLVVAQSISAYGPVTMSGDATITSLGAITVTKIAGTTPGGTCTGGQFVSIISASGVPTCTTPAGGGVPSGGPPQLVGYSATNTGEAETLSGDATLTRAGLNSYTIAVTKTSGVAFTGLATAAIPLSIANGGRGSSTAPTAAGQIDVAQSTTAFGAVTLSGDATITSAGAITVTKTSGTTFSALATAATPLSIALGGNGSATAPTIAGQVEIAQSTTAYAPETMSGDATITSLGVISVTKTSGTAFSALATATVPLSITNGGRGSSTAPVAGQIDVAQSGTAFGPVTMSGDATISSLGVISVTKIAGTTPGGTCTSPQFVQVISASGVPTCATPAGGGVPSGAPPQLIGYSATNIGEAETVGGDLTLSRSSAGVYTATVTKSNGTLLTSLFAPLASPTFTGTVTAPFLNLTATGGTQIYLGSATTPEGTLSSINTSNINVAGGAHFTPTNWIADATTAGIMSDNLGVTAFFEDTGLTIGSTFTPTEIATLSTAGFNLMSGTYQVNGTGFGGSCTGGQFVSAISTGVVPTCATPAGGGVPSGAPPQLVGYSATNTGEAETLSGDSSVTRSGANSYVMVNTGLHYGTNAVALPSTAPTSGGIPYFSSTSALASSALLTANLPVIGGGAGAAPTVGTVSGNTTKFVTSTGTLTSTHCASWDASGNAIDAGATCSPHIIYLKGTANGTSYTDSSGAWANVDATHLSTAVVIPVGQDLTITATATATNGIVGDVTAVGIADGGVVLNSSYQIAPNTPLPVALQVVIVGDGASHTIALQFWETSGTATIFNSTGPGGSGFPAMILRLEAVH